MVVPGFPRSRFSGTAPDLASLMWGSIALIFIDMQKYFADDTLKDADAEVES